MPTSTPLSNDHSEPREWEVAVTIARISDILSKPFFERYAKPYALSLTEWRVIVVVYQAPGISAQEIGTLTGMHPMNISRAVARLRAKDRLVSTTDSLNHRRRNLTLTDAGRAIYNDLIISAQEQARTLLEVLTIAERQFLTAILDRLLERALEIAAPARGD